MLELSEPPATQGGGTSQRAPLTAATQDVIIDKLIRTRMEPSIDHVSNELLAQVFLFNKGERQILAGVSRRRRAVIMDTPRIWSETHRNHCYLCPRLLKFHLPMNPSHNCARTPRPKTTGCCYTSCEPVAYSLDPIMALKGPLTEDPI